MTTTDDAGPTRLPGRMAAWVRAGLITPEQAAGIARWEAEHGAEPARAAELPAARPAALISPVVEALTYVGGAVMVAAITTVTVGYWDRIGAAGQITIPAVATALLLLAGAVVPRAWRSVGTRMRAAVWLTSSATFDALAAIVVDRAGLSDGRGMLVVAAAVLVQAAVLWMVHRTVLQQAATFAATEFFAAAVWQEFAADAAPARGAVIAGIGVVWGVLGRQGLLPGGGRWAPPAAAAVEPAASTRLYADQRRWSLTMGAVGCVIGGIMLASGGSQPWTGLVPIAVVLAAGIALNDLTVLILAAVGTLIVLPSVVDRYLHSTLGTAVVLLAVGAAMVGLAVLVARRQSRRATPDSRAAPGSGKGGAA